MPYHYIHWMQYNWTKGENMQTCILFFLLKGQFHRYLKKWHKMSPFITKLVLNFNYLMLNEFRSARCMGFNGWNSMEFTHLALQRTCSPSSHGLSISNYYYSYIFQPKTWRLFNFVYILVFYKVRELFFKFHNEQMAYGKYTIIWVFGDFF